MPQISLYIDENTLKKVEKRAKQAHTSVSKWVGNSIKKSINDEYPEDFLELFGALKDIPFKRPPQGIFADDSPREPF
ncbi:MAG: hypothetical protein LBQ61_04105 [Spirochaetales bacterium]|jgi:hypothetical protein|nr:hypothetical protein [Spirochaetales bacterium]